MKKLNLKTLMCVVAGLTFASAAQAQLSENTDKFLGNITTRYQMDAGGGVPQFYRLWNQVTCENESKWGSVEGTRNSYNWGCDNAFNYAKQHKFTYKFHALVWGAQYPNWFSGLSLPDRYTSIVKWFDAVKKKYNTLPLIDVVNEAVGNHQQGNSMMKESLGGGGKTGYDNLIKAFEMAYERWPDAILIYNDYNTFQWDTDNYIDLVRTLRDYGAPIDAYGCQSHDLTDCSLDKFKSAEQKIQNSLKMPMYSTEYDIGTADDNLQLQRYKEQIPYMWEKDYCAGITLWGYVYGATWTTDGNSGLYKNGKERPAMTWLKEYMATDKAKEAKSPFPGMKKEASIYIRPLDLKVAKGDVLPIKVRARMATKTIEKIDLYVGTELIATMTEEPYITEYEVPASGTTGWKTLKAVVTTTDGETYERQGRFNVLTTTTKREPYNGEPFQLPCTIPVNEYDKGSTGVAFSNATRTVTSTVKDGAWMEYTVDVPEDGLYSLDAEIAASNANGSFHVAEYGFDDLTFFTDIVAVPKTGGTSTFQTMHSVLKKPFKAGRHRICLNIDKGGFCIKNLTFNRHEEDANMKVSVTASPATIVVGETSTITVSATSTTSTINNIRLYANNLLIGTISEEPFTFEYTPTITGSLSITALATDAEGKVKQSTAKTLKVNPKRESFSGIIEIPGTIECEYYDKGGEGLAYHDNEETNQGDANYRSGEGVDIVKGNGGKAIGYTAQNEWVEYSVNVKKAGKYSCDAVVSSGTTGAKFTLHRIIGTQKTTLFTVDIPQTGNNDWGTYRTITKDLLVELTEGEQIFRITITGANGNIDKLIFTCNDADGIQTLEAEELTAPAYNLAGQKVDGSYQGFVIRNGRKVIVNRR